MRSHFPRPVTSLAWIASIASASIATVALLAACSSPDRPAAGNHPELVAAARAQLNAESTGQAAGDPATASSLSTADAAIADQFYARRLGAQIAAGDTTDYAFDTLSVTAYPLDGGAADFIAFEELRGHSGGDVFREVALYHRDAPAGPWKVSDRAYLNANIDLPRLELDRKGQAHLLTEAELRSAQAVPTDVAGRYATAMNDGSASGKLRAGSFLPGQATTGVIQSAAVFLNAWSSHGSGSMHWDARPGGRAVALTSGALVFASVQETEMRHCNVEGTNRFFITQDSKRLVWGGLLAPGFYSDVTATSLVSLAVAVRPNGPPDVVALDTTMTAVTGTIATLFAP